MKAYFFEKDDQKVIFIPEAEILILSCKKDSSFFILRKNERTTKAFEEAHRDKEEIGYYSISGGKDLKELVLQTKEFPSGIKVQSGSEIEKILIRLWVNTKVS